jgi:hypothetical protein
MVKAMAAAPARSPLLFWLVVISGPFLIVVLILNSTQQKQETGRILGPHAPACYRPVERCCGCGFEQMAVAGYLG